MLDLTHAHWRYEPYPIASVDAVMEPSRYEDLVAAFPAVTNFVHMDGAYDKFSLSERNNPDGYRQAILESPIWTSAHAYLKSKEFLRSVHHALKAAGLPGLSKGRAYTTRFEFSALPANGGKLDPHTDIPSKVVTIIVPMVTAAIGWDPVWGGGTDVLRPGDPFRLYLDYKEPRHDFELVVSLPYAPNRAVIFEKTFNSWHSVGPIQGPEGVLRRTLTINVEAA
jgi:hypothetical protein